MIVLACETSTLLGSVSILENEKVLSFEESMRQGSHSEVLNIFIEKALLKAGKKLSDIDLFATGIGPGSFTGIRICLNTIKTLAYCFNKPVVGINSLHNLAAQAASSLLPNETMNIPIISMINAYKNMVYVASYSLKKNILEETKKPEVVRVQNLTNYISEKSIVCGDGFLTYEKYFSEEIKQNIIRKVDISDEPRAIMTGQMAFKSEQSILSWNQVLPLYLRASEAEENLQGIKFWPII